MQKKIIEYGVEVENNVMMFNDLTRFYGRGDKEYTKRFLKFKVKQKKEDVI